MIFFKDEIKIKSKRSVLLSVSLELRLYVILLARDTVANLGHGPRSGFYGII